MKARCYNRRHKWYQAYGAKGVYVCDRWRHNFSLFLADMGPRPIEHSLDRIDSAGNYEPLNCRWADCLTQAQNTRRGTAMIEFGGQRQSVRQVALAHGIDPKALRRRILLGESPNAAITNIKALRPSRWAA